MSDTGSIIQTVGAVASLATGNPAFYLAATAVSAIFFPPEQPGVEGPRLSDLKVQSSTYGKDIPVVYGSSRLAGNLIWLKNNQLEEVRVVTEEGGKGGGGGQEVVTYEYYATFAVAICEGEIDGIRKIWADSVLIYTDDASTSPMEVLAQKSARQSVTIYTGSATQEPDSLIEADVGAAPAYRGTAYVVFTRLPLKKYGNRIPNMTFEIVEGNTTPDQIASFDWERIKPGSEDQDGWCNTGYNLDSNFQAVSAHGLWTTTSPRDDNTVQWAILYPDGRQEYKGTFELPGNHTPSLHKRRRHGDLPFYASLKGGTSNDYNVYQCNPDNGLSGATGYYNTAGSFPTGPLPSVNESMTIRNGVLYRVAGNPWNNIYKATFPAGTTSNRRNETLFIDTSTFTGNPSPIVCDVDDQYIYFIEDGNTKIWVGDLLFGTEVAVWDTGIALNDIYYDADGDKLYGHVFANTVYEIDKTTGAATVFVNTNRGTNQSDGDAWAVNCGVLQYISHDANENPEQRRWWTGGDFLAPADKPLSEIITDLCTRSGLSTSQIDVTGISDQCAGFMHTKRGPVSEDLAVLARSYHFDAVDSGYKIKFVSRGGSSALTLTNDDLATHEYGQERPEEIEIVRERDISIPRRVDVTFIDETREYDPGSQYAERIVPEAEGIQNIELAVVMSASEAAAVAEVLLYEAWMGRITFQFSLPMKYSYLEPTDVVTLSLNEGTFTCRIVETEFGSGMLRVRGVQELSSVYSSEAVGEPGTGYSQTLKWIVDTNLKLLDMPIMNDSNDDAGFYMAAGPVQGSTFDGAQMFVSNDEGETYTNFDAIIAKSVIGYTTDVLADGEWYVFDRVNTVNIRMIDHTDTLTSVTELQALNNNNVCVIGQDGRWEVLHFADATLESDGTYTLSTLLRGKRGSEAFMNSHQTGDCFILLSESTTQRYNFGVDLIGLERYYKAVTYGKTLQSAGSTVFTNNAIGLKPYAPVNIKGSRDGSDNLTITWNRRTRVGGEWRDSVDASLGEDSEAYEVDIIQEASPTTVLRTISVSSETASYTAAQQVTDFGVAQSAILVHVYQISATFGRGYVGIATI